MTRHAVGVASLRLLGTGFPYGTLLVNCLGSLLMGLLIGVLATRLDGSQEMRLFMATGFLGGFTTFSAFSLDVVVLWERGAVTEAVIYGVGSVLVSIAALVIGLAAARSLGTV